MNTRPFLKLFGAVCLTASAASCVGGEDAGSASSELSGAVFTTLSDGTRVNQNIYDSKEDVYLDGGPGPTAPSGAAALDAGDYYFQVTDPSGKTLLSTDAIECRRFTISADGVIVAVDGDSGCAHATGADADHGDLGAITVQLMPYADTPNMGGEYKVWVTAVGDYTVGKGKHGFLPKYSKTDNFKVRVTDEPEPEPEPEPDAGHECFCGDGTTDDGEECDDGNTADGDGCSANCTIEPTPEPEPYCGDGTTDAGEECDDGNTADGDGCSANCTTEPPTKEPCCGDGEVNVAGEECDDGNLQNGDGCSSTCRTELVTN